MKPRIVFHLGTHKTGSTTIQFTLHNANEQLAEHGIIYPDIFFGSEPELKKSMGLPQALRDGGRHAEDALNRIRQEFASTQAQTMILSEEYMGVLAIRFPGCLEPLRSLQDEFELQSICFLRRPDYFLESYWNQLSKEARNKEHIDKYAASTFFRRYLDYPDFLSEWGKVTSLTALGYENSRTKGLLPTFCDVVGIPQLTEVEHRNVSPSMDCAAILAALAAKTGEQYRWPAIEEKLEVSNKRTALGKKLRNQILQDFDKHRRTLQDRYGVTFPDDLPEENDDVIPYPSKELVDSFDEPEFMRHPPPPPVAPEPPEQLSLLSRIRRRLGRLVG